MVRRPAKYVNVPDCAYLGVDVVRIDYISIALPIKLKIPHERHIRRRSYYLRKILLRLQSMKQDEF